MDCSADIVKQAQVGVRKSDVLQPSDVFCGLKKFEMPHFHLLYSIIDSMQRLWKKREFNWSNITDG